MTDFFNNFFMFNPEHPLTFVRIDFWIFFVLVYAVFALIYRRRHLRNLFLLIASFYFYYKASGLFVLLLVFSTVTDFYLGALHLSASRRTPTQNSCNRECLFKFISVSIFQVCLFLHRYLQCTLPHPTPNV